MSLSNNDDPWADLYKDLGVPASETPKPAAPVEDLLPPPLPAFDGDSEEESDVIPESGDEADAGGEEGEAEAASGEEGEGEGEGDRKRRRRRRRRKKKPGEPAGEGESAPPARPAVRVRPEREAAESEPEEEAEEIVATVSSAEEGTSPEAARELIATWNVPSWSEIVAGLYRPER